MGSLIVKNVKFFTSHLKTGLGSIVDNWNQSEVYVQLPTLKYIVMDAGNSSFKSPESNILISENLRETALSEIDALRDSAVINNYFTQNYSKSLSSLFLVLQQRGA